MSGVNVSFPILSIFIVILLRERNKSITGTLNCTNHPPFLGITYIYIT